MALVASNKVIAENFSVAIGGDNNATISVTNTGFAQDQLETLQSQISSMRADFLNASEVNQRDAIDSLLNSQIDEITELIKQNKSITALDLLEKLYKRVAENASGKIRFRIKANIGICHHLNGNNEKASEFLLDAYDQAPNEPNAISNKVLALLLLGKPEEAFEFGKEQLTEKPSNEALAGYVLQASRAIPEVKNPLEIIPKALQDTLSVLVGHIHFLQHRGEYGEWWKIAHAGAKLFPDNFEIKKYSAIADAEEIFNAKKIQKNLCISRDQNLKLIAAAKVLFDDWHISVNGEANLLDGDKINAGNLANIFYFLHNIDDLRNLIGQAISKCKEDENFLINIAQISLHCGQIDLAEKILNELEPNNHLEFLRFGIAQTKGDTEYLSQVKDSAIKTFPPSEQSCSKVVVKLAKLAELKVNLSAKHFGQLLELAGTGVRELLIIAHEAQRHELKEISEAAFKRACKNINPESHIVDRLMLGGEAYCKGDWRAVIDSLNGYISTHNYSDELRFLAVAFANELPVQQNAISFFEELPPEVASIQQFKTLKGVLFYNQGDLVKAEAELVSVLKTYPEDLNALTTLLNAYARQNKEAEIKGVISEVKPNAIKGNPVFMMHLAQLMKKYGRGAEAIAFGYRVLSENPNDQKVIPLYIGLLLLGDKDGNLIPSSNIVQKEYCVQLTNQNGIHFDFLYDDNPVSHIPLIDLKHPLVVTSIGKSIGDKFKQDRKGFPPIIWEITGIKHKYLHALHTNMEQFETNFPESNTLFMVTLPDSGDISSILEIIKADAEKKQEVLGSYLDKSLPLGILAALISRDCDVISAAEMLLNHNIKIYTNGGSVPELESAIALLELSNFDAVVLDTYTSWHVAVSNLFPILLKVFKNIIVPQSVLDEIQFLIQDCDGFASGEKMSIGWRDGQYQRYIRTEDDNQNRLTFIKKQRDKILQHCKVEVVSWAEKPNEMTSKVIEMAGTHFWNSANLSLQPNRLLLSEDLFYRQWATLALGLKNSIWLDAVLKYCYKLKLITLEELSEAIVHFSTWGHSHIILDSEILLSVFGADKTEGLIRFQSVCKNIGIQDADFPSHLSVVRKFLLSIWTVSENKQIKLVKATHLILDQLFRFVPNRALCIIVLCFEAPLDMEECIIDWRESNGISDTELVDAYNHMMAESISKEQTAQ
ncbi:MAG: hypothetical protein WBC07_13570 [Methylotenera sp.]